MRLLHTSDWHLGRSFHGVGLLGAQAGYLDHLVEVVRDEQVDAVVVAGDVYDRAIPAPDAVELLSETLLRLRDAGAEVVLAPGNHDSPRRLAFGSRLLERAGVHVRTGVGDLGRPVLVGDAAIYPLPYLDPASCTVLAELGVTERSHTAVLGAAMERVRADAAGRGPRTVVAAHCFASGGAGSDSERDITSGGVSMVPAELFDGVAYAALGHLHRPQQIGERVRYSGAPVAMSFSEAGQVKGSLLVEVRGEGEVAVQTVPAPVERPLARLRGTLEELLTGAEHAWAEDAYVQATITDPLRPRRAMERLRQRFPDTLSLVLEPEGAPVAVHGRARSVRGRPPVEVCSDFIRDVRYGHPATDAERAVVVEALGATRVGRAEADESGRTGAGAAGAGAA